MLRARHAWRFTMYEAEQTRDEQQRCGQAQARAARIGLWAQARSMAP